jgi:hypothetical protein
LGALGHILAVEPSCLADNIHKCYDFAFLHKILLQDAWVNEDIENLYGSCIIASILKGELIRKGQVTIVQIRKPKGIGETSEQELKELADVLVNNYG